MEHLQVLLASESSIYQRGLITGYFGPDTRAAAKHAYGFDLEAACRTIPGVTVFVQPDGTEIEWGPESA